MLQEFLNTHTDTGDVRQQGLAPDLVGFGESEKPALSYTGYMVRTVLHCTFQCTVVVLPFFF
jgi:hypothetical protein